MYSTIIRGGTAGTGCPRYPWYRQLAGAPAGQQGQQHQKSGLGPFREQETKKETLHSDDANAGSLLHRRRPERTKKEKKKRIPGGGSSISALSLDGVSVSLGCVGQSDTSDSDLSQATSTRVGRDGRGRGKRTRRVHELLHHIIL